MEPVTPAEADQPQDEDPFDLLWRETVVGAWLAPLLAGAVTSHTPAAQQNLARWLRFASSRHHLCWRQI